MKTRNSFIQEVLRPAKVAAIYSDLPNFIRDQMLSEKFIVLDAIDQALYAQLAMRAARYRVRSIYYRGRDIAIPAGGFWTRYTKLLEYAPYLRGKDDSIKRVRTSIARLVKAGFIHKEDLLWRRGLLLTLTGWAEYDQGHSGGHSNLFSEDLTDFPSPPFWKPK